MRYGRSVARFELLPPARHRRESLGERVDYTGGNAVAKTCTCQHGPRGTGKGISIASRRPERLLRAPRLALQILELLRVARRVAVRASATSIQLRVGPLCSKALR